MSEPVIEPVPARRDYNAAEIGAIAHLYRGEVYRSTVWRSRLDNTTNWSVVTTGLALSLAYADANASMVPLILVGLLVAMFLVLEARRYRYFNVCRARCRLMETDFYAPLLRGEGASMQSQWNLLLADHYDYPRFHVTKLLALGRRLRKNYLYIFVVQAVAYIGKLFIHPTPIADFEQFLERAAVGPLSGTTMIIVGAVFHGTWFGIAFWTLRVERRTRRHGKLIAAT